MRDNINMHKDRHQQCDQIGRFWTLANFSKPVATISCPNLRNSEAIFVKVSKSLIFLVKSFLGNFYRHLATFYWSHWTSSLRGEVTETKYIKVQ